MKWLYEINKMHINTVRICDIIKIYKLGVINNKRPLNVNKLKEKMIRAFI